MLWHDITHNLEIEKKLYDQMLRKDLALKAGTIGIWEWFYDTNTLIWDDTMYAIYGIDKEKDKSSPYTMWSNAVDSSDEARVQENLFNAKENNVDYDVAFWITLPNDERKYIKAFGKNQFDTDGNLVGMIGINTDISEEKRKVLALQEQSKLAAIGEMINNIAHQWRQPLATLSSLNAGLNIKYQLKNLDDEYMNHYASEMELQIQNMSSTINDFRDFFILNKEKMHFHLEDVIKEALSISEAMLKNNFIEVKMNFKAFSSILSYKNEFKQVIVNLLSNAKDALVDSAREDKKIEITTFEDKDTIGIQVQDNGGGVDIKVLSNVFEPYFTTKFKHQGTGLGLYMSKMIIEEHMNGSIKIYNNKDGAIVEVVFVKENI